MIRSPYLYLFFLVFASCQRQVAEQVNSEKDSIETTDTTEQFENNTLDNFQNLVEDFESPERNEWQNPELILQSFGDLQKKTIADIGAGTGYFTFRIAQKGAKVLAVDIEQQFLDYIEDRKLELDDVIGYDLVQTVLSKEDDPLLPSKSVDGALLVNTYHFIDHRVDYMKKVRDGLKNHGQLIIVDYKKGNLPLGPDESFKIPAAQVVNELRQAGFIDIKLDEKSLEYQYLITAKK